MTTTNARDRAQRIADMTVQVAREQSAGETGHDWTSGQSFADYMYTLGSVEARVEETSEALIVVAWPRMHPHGNYFTNVASAALDRAAGRIDDETGELFTFTHGRIESGNDDHEARLILPKPQECDECGAGPGEDCEITLQGACPGALV